MKKTFTILTAALMLLAMFASPIRVMGEDTSTLTLSSSKKFGTSDGSTLTTETTPSITWTVHKTSGTGAIQNSYQSAYHGQQFGTSTNVWGGTFSATYNNTVTSVKVDANTGGSATLSVTVGGTSFSCGNNTSVSVTKNSSSSGANYYEFTGSGSGAVVITLTGTSKACYFGGVVVTYTTSSSTCATPTFSPAEGDYYTSQLVSISCSTTGATIYYTTDGTAPSTSSSVYSTPLSISSTTTLKAIAVASGYDNSSVATAQYNILPTVFNQDWEGAMNGWTFVNVTGDQVWNVSSYSGNHYAKMSGYSGSNYANEDWCISPAFDLGDYTNPYLTFTTARSYHDGNVLEVYFSNNYDGTNVSSATWTQLTCTLPAQPSSGYTDFTSSGNIDLSSYSGSNCYIGFKYTSTTSAAVTWELDDIVLASQTTTPTITLTPSSIDVGNNNVTGTQISRTFTVSQENLTEDVTLTANLGSLSPSSVAQGAGDTEITWTYTPNATGNFSATITATSTGADPQTLTISGSAVEPIIGDCYELVTSTPQDWSGAYIITGTNSGNYYALTGVSSNLGTTAAVSVVGDKIESTATTDGYQVIIEATTNGYSLYMEGFGYLGYNSDAASGSNYLHALELFEANTCEWTITISNNEVTLTNVRNTGRKLQFNYNDGNSRFACYTSNQVKPNLFKYTGTVVVSPVINVTSNTMNLAYNETSGSISYSIDHPTTGTSLNATKDAAWITSVTVGEESVAITCSANESSEDRSATITLSYTGAEDVTVTVNQAHQPAPFVASTYTLATSIMPGKHYIIVGVYTDGENVNHYYAMGEQKTNNRGAVAVTLSNETITSVEGVYEFVVSGAKIENTYTYYSIYDKENTGFLYASSSSKNYLNTEATLDNNGIWTITVSSTTSESTITAQGSNTHNVMRFNYNNGSPLFACYSGTTGTLPYLYEKVDDNNLELYSDTYLSNNGHAITVPVDGTLTVNNCNFVNTGGEDQLCFKDGAQLLGFTGNYVTATVQRNIEKYTAVNSKDHYYLVATPVADGNDPATNSMASGDYDLYYFDQTQEKEWVNYKQAEGNVNPGFSLVKGKGYLYARGDGDVTINLAGDINNNTSGSMALTYSSTAHLPGLNLVGNPYLVNITNMNLNGSAVSYYMLTTEGTFVSTTAAETPIKVGRGFMVQATEGNTTLNLNPSSKDAKGLDDEVIRLEVANSQYKDVAYVRFGNSVALNKINHINDNAPMLYINNENGDYAVAVYDNREEVKSVNVNFKANTLGRYTISAKAQNGSFSYMHLIDRLTGVDTDLLNDDYSFIGSKNDIAGRFILRFETSNNTSVNETFAFQSGSDIIVNGEGELQIFDVMGRMVKNTVINGVEAIAMPQGVYIFKLNGNVQKIVVR